MLYLVVRRSSSVVAEINRNGNSLLLVCDLMAVVAFLVSLMLHRKGKGMRFSDGSVARRYSRCLHRRHPSQILPAPAAPFGAAIPKLF